MFEKILIANRGAIAVRIIRTLKELGVKSVAVYAEADGESRHVSLADEAYSLGEGGPAQTYLDQDRLFAIIRESGAQAVHPGYGFLSENAGFAERCEREGVAFLGPTPDQMEAFGLKHSARELAKKAGVPMLPGTELLDTVEEALAAAENIGYPVMLKSTAGGGGIGMQLCYGSQELEKHFASVKRLGENNFSNSGVFLEKFVERARHIEVQIFGDGAGRAIALGERDCSSQRRNQKVIEETPAPNLPDPVRRQLHQSAVALMESIGYRSAGTVEFIYDPAGEAAYFLEVNTRLQVEHGVTEQVYGVDLVAWMVRLGCGEMPALDSLNIGEPSGHAIQVRVYAEDPGKDFQPSAGLLTEVAFPDADGEQLRIDHWLEPGLTVSPFFDPMLAKIIVWRETREAAREALLDALGQTRLYGIETNLAYLQTILREGIFVRGEIYTRFLNSYAYRANTVDVLAAGTLTTVQDVPGRVGYWNIGVPPSGPFDDYSFRLGNRLLGNPETAAGLELTLNGPTLRFNRASRVVIAGADLAARLEIPGAEAPVALDRWQVVDIPAAAVLCFGKVNGAGARAYLLVQGGFDCPNYLGSKSTFTLGQFGGHGGRALRKGDVLHLSVGVGGEPAGTRRASIPGGSTPTSLSATVPAGSPPTSLASGVPALTNNWQIRVIYGPHGAPEFFTESDMDAFFAADWEVHYNSSRTGVRLIGPKPQWARTDGGEAGMHPSNIHDNAYAFGSIDFTGDMPVILGPDGPSLGGFVCPATVIAADRWKLGQLKAGDKIRFLPVTVAEAVAMANSQAQALAGLVDAAPCPSSLQSWRDCSPIAHRAQLPDGTEVVMRVAGDEFLLVELGDAVLDIALRFRIHGLMLRLEEMAVPGVIEMTPGIRSLQIHYRPEALSLDELVEQVMAAAASLGTIDSLRVPSRIVHLPLSWNDAACQLAVEKYIQSVRKDAPWCPDNLEFIRRINGLDSIDEVKRIVFDASYVVMGLGDVYLGAPVATPLDPRHRLVTTKYNPARTWTAENSVGIGGSYLCIYGMEGPGGYQFVGRTLQMWNRYRHTAEFTQPWLLRFFDQIRFYEVSGDELLDIRRQFPLGNYPLRVEETEFSLAEYRAYLDEHCGEIDAFTRQRQQAFAEELQRWKDSGQLNFSSETPVHETGHEEELPDHAVAVESEAAGSIWQIAVNPGTTVKKGDLLVVLESMKMEIEVHSPEDGVIEKILCQPGQPVQAGQRLLILKQEGAL
ncbi:MAG: urea carboxylase [Porticoccaceae bacterium]